jgi:hypothetical protein
VAMIGRRLVVHTEQSARPWQPFLWKWLEAQPKFSGLEHTLVGFHWRGRLGTHCHTIGLVAFRLSRPQKAVRDSSDDAFPGGTVGAVCYPC